jgi:hypothetical protein
MRCPPTTATGCFGSVGTVVWAGHAKASQRQVAACNHMLFNIVLIEISLQANVGKVLNDTEAGEAKYCIVEHGFKITVIDRVQESASTYVVISLRVRPLSLLVPVTYFPSHMTRKLNSCKGRTGWC